MPVRLEDRPIEKVREEVIDQLVLNYSHGIISLEAFERRLDVASESCVHQSIVEQIEDLDTLTEEGYKEQKAQAFQIQYGSHNNDEESIVNIFGGSDRSGRWNVPKNLNIISIFGGSNIDFTNAVFQYPETEIKSLCIFGGDNIYVPEGVNVVSKIFCIFGGVNNKANSAARVNKGPTLRLSGFALFGGTNIKIKTNIKEKFISFANQLKGMFN